MHSPGHHQFSQSVFQQSTSSHQRSPSTRSTPAHDDRNQDYRYTPGSQGFAGQNFDGQNPMSNFSRQLNFDGPQYPQQRMPQSQSFMSQQQQQPMGMNQFGGGIRNSNLSSPINYQNVPSSNMMPSSLQMPQNFGYQNFQNLQGQGGMPSSNSMNMMESMMNNMPNNMQNNMPNQMQLFQQFMQLMSQNPNGMQMFQNFMGMGSGQNFSAPPSQSLNQSAINMRNNPNNVSSIHSEPRGDESLLDTLGGFGGGNLPSESHFIDQLGGFTSRTDQKEETAGSGTENQFLWPSSKGLKETTKNQDRDPLQETTSNWENAPIVGGGVGRNTVQNSVLNEKFEVPPRRENSLSKKAEQENTNPFDEIPVGGNKKGGFGSFVDTKETRPSFKESVIDQPVAEPKINPFDEIPVGGRKAKRFEDMIEEQLKSNPDAISSKKTTKTPVEKKEFLKKSSKIHVLKDAQKSKRKVEEEEEDNMFGEAEEDLWGNKEDDDDARPYDDESHRKQEALLAKNLFTKKPLNKKPLESKRSDGSSKEELDLFLKNEQQINGKRGFEATELSPPQETKAHNRKAHLKHHEDEENLSDQERGSFKFDDIDEWRSPDRGGYNMNKYIGKGSNTTKSELENRKTVQSGRSQESPGYKFEDEEMLNRPAEDEEGRINKTEEDEDTEKGGKGYFWEKKAPEVMRVREQNRFERREEPKEQVIDAFMDQRVQALEKEISKFKAENERVKGQRKQCEDMLKDTERQMEEFKFKREEESKEIEDWKQEEKKNIRKEKKLVAESHQKIYQNVSSKKEREEIESLKGHLEELRNDLQNKENKWRLNRENLKKKLDEENLKTLEYKQQLKEFEKQRLRKNTPNAGANKNLNTSQQQQQQKKPQRSVHEERKIEQGRFSNAKVIEDEESDEDDGDVIKEEMHEDDSDEENGGEYERMFNVPSRKNSTLSKVQHQQQQQLSANKFSRGSHTPETKTNQGQVQGQRLNYNNESVVPRSGHIGHTLDIADRKEFREDDYDFNTNPYYKKYMTNQRNNRPVKEIEFDDGKIEVQRVYEDGRREDIFTNGVVRQVMPDGYSIVYFTNKDIRQTLPDSTIVYYYFETKTAQTKLPEGQCIYKFANGQLEYHYTDDSKDIYFADGTRKLVFPNGEEETHFNDGTIQRVGTDKLKVIDYANGLKDVVYPDGMKIRHYPDGKVKKYHPDGTVEIL